MNAEASSGAVQRVREFWDTHVAAWLADESQHLRSPLAEWRQAYRGQGIGVVEDDAFVEPYLGALEPGAAGAFLALQPGRADLQFQGRSGIFADEIRRAGSYSAWAMTWPYLRPPWTVIKGRNRHHSARLEFLQRWLDDPSVPQDRMIGFELYPWHATKTTAPIRPNRAIVDEFIWQPLSELAPGYVFAFGSDWFPVLEHHLKLPVVQRLGAGGIDYGSRVASRRVVEFEGPGGVRVIAEMHQGGATPPAADEVARLRDAITSKRGPRGSVMAPAPSHPSPPPIRTHPAAVRPPAAAGRPRLFTEFWARLVEAMQARGVGAAVGLRIPDRNWLVVGRPVPRSSLQFDFCRDGLRHQLNLRRPDREEKAAVVAALTSIQSDLEAAFGSRLRVEPMPTTSECRIAAYLPGSIDTITEHDSYVEWFIDAHERMQRVIPLVARAIQG